MENKKNKEKIGIYDDCINTYVYNEIASNKKCLDVGCWTGNLGKKLIENKNCVVDGVDSNRNALKVAKLAGYRNLYEIDLNCNFYEIKQLIKNNYRYDFIICADILEHLIQPEEVLLLLKKLLKNNGEIIISVPNVAFIKTRIDLFFGKFEYNPNGGIMDETHLRFFTKKGIVKKCKKAGFSNIQFSGYSLVKNKFFFLRLLARFMPRLFAIQFLVKLKIK